MTDQRSSRNLRITIARDPLLEAFVEFARSAIRSDREAADRRAKLRTMDGGKREGRAA